MKQFVINPLLMILFLLIINSCSDSTNSAIKKLYGKEIVFNNQMKQVLKDTIQDINISDIPIKIVLNAEPRLCNSCFANYYKVISHYIQTIGNDSVKCIFIINDVHKEVLRTIMKEQEYKSIIVLLDNEKHYLSNNSLEKYHNMLTCFLLDKNNRVVLVGDPLRSSRIRELYNEQIRLLLANEGMKTRNRLFVRK